jgi:hypothetical protein
MQKGTLATLLILLVAVIGAVVWLARTPAAPSIAFTMPAGGETWQAGETHTISWTSRGIPARDSVSITLRRVPPPPLQEEGQEFDPIVFTNLPNTGSTIWNISPAYPGGTYVLGISAYKSVPVTNPVSAESKPFTLTHPKVAIDLYPLYTGASWNKARVEDVTMGTTTYSGASVESAAIDAGMNPGKVFTAFEQYYASLLAERGWHVANDLAAGGHVGGQTGYRNGPGVILVRYHIDYQNVPDNAPSECPCAVTLSLFSNVGD